MNWDVAEHTDGRSARAQRISLSHTDDVIGLIDAPRRDARRCSVWGGVACVH